MGQPEVEIDLLGEQDGGIAVLGGDPARHRHEPEQEAAHERTRTHDLNTSYHQYQTIKLL